MDEDGNITFIGRTDDVFQASDYKISPFELEAVLIEHPAVAEAAVAPGPDPVRLAVPKAYIALAPGHEPTRETALDILRYARRQLPAYQRVRRLEFFDLPKTISGKIRRVELRGREQQGTARRTNFVKTTFEETPECERCPPVAPAVILHRLPERGCRGRHRLLAPVPSSDPGPGRDLYAHL